MRHERPSRFVPLIIDNGITRAGTREAVINAAVGVHVTRYRADGVDIARWMGRQFLPRRAVVDRAVDAWIAIPIGEAGEVDCRVGLARGSLAEADRPDLLRLADVLPAAAPVTRSLERDIVGMRVEQTGRTNRKE